MAPAARDTGVTLNDSPSPAREDEAERVTLPAKLLTLWRVTVDVPLEPTGIVREFGLAAIVKSLPTTVTGTVTECEVVPLVPVTLTL